MTSHDYIQPVRRILTEEDLTRWQSSESYNGLVAFIVRLADSVKGKELGTECELTPSVKDILKVLDSIQTIIGRHPVVTDKDISRFGKVEFRDFYDEVSSSADKLISLIDKTSELPGVSKELKVYLVESWGNRTRIDYGSGHELNFMCFLYCLYKVGILDLESDSEALVLVVFKKYLDNMRILQTKYWLEPAGSHGVWGLDDYHFLPFLFGAAQLAPMERMRPSSIHIPDYVDMFKDKFFYFACIDFINQTKTGAQSLRWHSPMLDDISGVKKWSKVAEGMIKMYKAEVLGKLPIIQHVFFGSIIAAPEGVSATRDLSGIDEEHGHIHIDHDPDSNLHLNTFGDCCGIKVPSAVAASAMEKKHFRPVPFD
ncbi:unnamed protein product [Kuraishia capsulata CBS 1993]|uniref:Serine/threonine-protein phosphatase 2A activator n=1 Tax=Kuraishia capsulata CBS 1993 TaxID=1382522 RepID=W6MTU1_9ASCO|nr:uncharacterized protein KUCA_T00004651001 [Kuraishia capsulata CBS 1993]CDK28667.1 unnamed protein product [Kuraishia capsulata CBS 1993]